MSGSSVRFVTYARTAAERRATCQFAVLGSRAPCLVCAAVGKPAYSCWPGAWGLTLIVRCSGPLFLLLLAVGCTRAVQRAIHDAHGRIASTPPKGCDAPHLTLSWTAGKNRTNARLLSGPSPGQACLRFAAAVLPCRPRSRSKLTFCPSLS